MNEKELTTRWENVKNRVGYLMKNTNMLGQGAELGLALCEEIDRLEERLSNLAEEIKPFFSASFLVKRDAIDNEKLKLFDEILPPTVWLGRLDVEKYLTHYGIEFTVKKQRNKTVYHLSRCLFDPSHTQNNPAIIQSNNGLLTYRCYHIHCLGRTWTEARTLISGQDSIVRFMIGAGPIWEAMGKDALYKEIDSLKARVNNLEKKLSKYAALPASIVEAVNSGECD